MSDLTAIETARRATLPPTPPIEDLIGAGPGHALVYWDTGNITLNKLKEINPIPITLHDFVGPAIKVWL